MAGISSRTARGVLAAAAGGALIAGIASWVTPREDAPEPPPALTQQRTEAASQSAFEKSAAGDCLSWTPTGDPKTDRRDVSLVSCDDAHLFEVASTLDVSTLPGNEFATGAPFPTAARLTTLRDQQCTGAVNSFLDGRFDPDGRYTVGLMFPSQKAWDDGARDLKCGLQSISTTGHLIATRGSVRDQDQSRGYPVGTCVGVQDNAPTDPVDCSEPHALEVTARIDLSQQFPGPWPIVDDQDAFLEQRCTDASADYIGGADALRNTTLTVFWDNRTQPSWDAGSRTVDCSVGKTVDAGFATVTGTAKGPLLIDGQAPVPPPPLGEGRAIKPPLPGAAPPTS